MLASPWSNHNGGSIKNHLTHVHQIMATLLAGRTFYLGEYGVEA